MRSCGIFLLLWLGLSALAPARAVGAADAVLSEVSAALAAGQYEDAVTVAGSGLAESGLPDATRGRLLVVRGLGHQALGANDDALADFTQALSISALPQQERARALFARGVSLDSLGRLEDAAGDYSAVLRLVPGAVHALNNRANVRRRQGRTQEAQRDYMAALKGPNPNPQYPYFGLGQIAEAQGDAAAARDYYNKAVAAAPGFALALERLQAMGAPVEGPAGLPANTGLIVLKPPSGKSRAPAASPPGDMKPAAAVPALAGMAAPAAAAKMDASLRPTILDGPAPSRGKGLAQLGAWRSEQEARNGWAAARDRADGALDGLTPLIVRAEIPGRGVFYRLRTAPVMPVGPFCSLLGGKGLSCIPARD